MNFVLRFVSSLASSVSVVLFVIAVAMGSSAAMADEPLMYGTCTTCTTTCPADCTSTACSGGTACDLSCNCTLGGGCHCAG